MKTHSKISSEKSIFRFMLSFFLLCAFFVVPMEAQVVAFPGAEGFGALTTGGRGGTVYHVTNLNDEGAGSFRDAVSEPNRTIVFDVGGVIKINSRLQVASDITIAGQTAPGDGITVYGERVAFSNNNIVRYMRFYGSIDMPRGGCTLIIDNLNNAIFDHVSVAWGRWDNLHIKGTTNVTMQYCIIAEPIDPQRFGALFERPDNITIHHCLWSNCQSRNPKGKAKIQYFNNVVYNWGVSAFVGGHSAANHYQDIVNNYFVGGPNSNESFFAMFTPTDHVYHSENYADLNKDGALNGRIITDEDFLVKEPKDQPTLLQKPFNISPVPVAIEDAAAAYKTVLAKAGVAHKRDAVEARQISQLSSLGKEGKIVRSEAEVGGIPTMKGGTAPKDSDKDGIPDKWEKSNKLNAKDPSDAQKITPSGYTNLENYLNSLVPVD